MDILGSSLDDLIKKDRKLGGGRGGKGGIHNKMRQNKGGDAKNVRKVDRPAGIRGGKRGTGIRGTGMRGSGAPRGIRGGAQGVAKVNRNPNRIQKERDNKPTKGGKTLVVNPNNRRQRRQGGLQKAAAAAGVKNKASPQAAGGHVASKAQEILQLKRKLRRALQHKKALTSGVAQQQQKPTQSPKQSARPQQQNNARRQATLPVKAASTQAAQQQRSNFANREPRGPIELRKLKVHNIDKATVTVQDLKTLFGKCGPLLNCNYDFDSFGQYLGTVTVIYLNEAHAFRAIGNYNRAAIDNKVMKVVYATDSERGPRSSSKGQADRPLPRFKQQGPKKHAQKTIRKR